MIKFVLDIFKQVMHSISVSLSSLLEMDMTLNLT